MEYNVQEMFEPEELARLAQIADDNPVTPTQIMNVVEECIPLWNAGFWDTLPLAIRWLNWVRETNYHEWERIMVQVINFSRMGLFETVNEEAEKLLRNEP